jgi:hypothetical protein
MADPLKHRQTKEAATDRCRQYSTYRSMLVLARRLASNSCAPGNGEKFSFDKLADITFYGGVDLHRQNFA